jgi:unsaturated rhamnogalacturonyl hydrolase
MKYIKDFFDGLMAASTPETPAWNVEHTLSKKPTKWNYVDGCVIKAALDLFTAAREQKYFEFAKNYIDFFINENGEIVGYDPEDYNCDQINMGKVLFNLYEATKEEKYKKAIYLLHSQLENHPRINAGNFWHKKIYPRQVWLDGLYMVQPFYMAYEMMFNNGKNQRDVFNQFKNVREFMRDKNTGLYYHGYDESRQMFWANQTTGLSKNFWTRSIGWYIMALVDTAEKLNEHFFYEYQKLQEYLKEALDAVLPMADPSAKLFYQVTNAPGKEGNYLETSGTCAIVYSLMKGARLGFLPVYYFDKGKEIFEAVVKNKLIKTDGGYMLKDICLVAGLGGMPGKGGYQPRDGTYEYYISEPRVNNDGKGLAPFIYSYAEVLLNNESGII